MGFSTMSRRAQAQTLFAAAAVCCAGWMVLYFNHVPERLLHPGRPIAVAANEYATGPMGQAAVNPAPKIILPAPVAASIPAASSAPAKAAIAHPSAVAPIALDAAPDSKGFDSEAAAPFALPTRAPEIQQAPNAELKGVASDTEQAMKPAAAMTAASEKSPDTAAMAVSQKTAASAAQASSAFAATVLSAKPAATPISAPVLAQPAVPSTAQTVQPVVAQPSVAQPAAVAAASAPVVSPDAAASAVAAAMAQGSSSVAVATAPAFDAKTTDKACLEWGPLPADALDALKMKLSADTVLRGSASVRQVRYPAVWSVHFSYRSAYEKTQILKLLAAKKVKPSEITKADREGAGLVVMGYFPTQEKAQGLNSALAAIGVADQLVAPVQPERVESSILFSNPTANTLTALKPYLVDTNVFPRAIACPAALPQATAAH